jgi:type IV pilus assembly protein PilV
MNPRTRRRAAERGSTLLEAMIALSVLLVGLVGMAKLQIYGMTSTQGARAQTQATQLAQELAEALAQLPSGDGHLTGAPTVLPASGGAPFGALLPLGVPTSGTNLHTYDDASPVPGARLDATLERNPEDASQPVFKRRWTVWDAGVASTGVAAKIIAVSVIWRERTIAAPKEIVLYVNSEVTGAFMANINAFH